MRKILIVLPLLFFIKGNAQYYYQLYYNLELQAQVTANQAARVASEKLYQNSYGKQRKAYDDIKEKATQVVVIKNHIYNQLRNVNSALKQGKQLEAIYYDFTKLTGNMGKMLELSVQKPQYSVLITNYYSKLYLHAMNAYENISSCVLNEENDYLMDSYDRQKILSKLQHEIKIMNGWTVHIINYLKNADKKPYFRHIGVLNSWYIQDKGLIQNIINNYNYNLNGW
jgi:hypothetical protein